MVRNAAGGGVPVTEICKVGCTTIACGKYATICSPNDADFSFPRGAVNAALPDRGGRIALFNQAGDPLTVVGVTPFPDSTGRAETTCNNLTGGYCYLWPYTSWTTGQRRAIIIVATQTPTPIPPTSTPTPTPTTGPWIKLKNTSFVSFNSLTNSVPASPVVYPPNDPDDDDLRPYFIIGGATGTAAGLAAAPGIELTRLNPSAKPNFRDVWTSYTSEFQMTPVSFLKYVAARKEHKSISSLSETSIDEDGICEWTGTTPPVINSTNETVFNSITSSRSLTN
jgi:hypothetical protein